jgi:hypothetical protein
MLRQKFTVQVTTLPDCDDITRFDGTYLGSYERPRSFNHQCLHCYKGKICDLFRYTVLLFAFGRGKIVTDTDLDFYLQTNPDQDPGFDEQR